MGSALIQLSKDPALRRAMGYYALFICLGLDTAILGPTLPALAGQTQARLGQMGLLFLVGAAGYTLGTTFGGRAFDRFRGHRILGIAQLVAAGLIVFIPVVPWFWLLLVILACKAFAEGVVNTGANVLLVWTYGSKVGPYMNALHFFFGLGAFLAPLLVAQVVGVAGGYRWAYWCLAALATLVGLRILTLSGSPPSPHAPDAGEGKVSSGSIRYSLVVTAAVFLFFYVGAEIAFGGWIYTYAVTLGIASETAAAYLNSGFWLSFTVGRLLSIPMATRFTPRQVLPSALLSCLGFLSLALLFPGSGAVMWLVVAGLGLCMAPVWPTGFTFAGQSLNMTARVSGLILLGDCFGGMVLPWLVGQVIETAGPQAMVYLVFSSLVLDLFVYVGMARLNRQLPGRSKNY